MLGILMYIQYIPVPALRAAPAERGCCRFSGFTTAACPERGDALLATILVGVLQAFKTIK
jgi:hypothetical protein